MATDTNTPNNSRYNRNPVQDEYEKLTSRGETQASNKDSFSDATANHARSPSGSSGSTSSGRAIYSAEALKDKETSLYNSSSTSPGILNLRFSRRQKLIGGGVAAGTASLAAVFFIFLSGPLQFIHFAQLLQKFHFTNNENFGDSRSAKSIIYTISGQANRGRLGYVNNKFADRWETKILNETGLRPVYTKGTQRFAGFQVVNASLARSHLAEFEKDGINTNDQVGNIVTSKGVQLTQSQRFVDLRGEKFRTKRSVIRFIGKSTDTSKIGAAMGSRLLIKRGGVDFHPLKNIKRKSGDSLIEYYQRVKDERASRDRNGIPDSGRTFAATDADEDGDGKPDGTATDQAVADKANELVNSAKEADAKGAGGSKTIKSLKAGLSKSAGPVVVVGALCTVKSFGQDIVDQQHKVIILPMMRIAVRMVATGNQVMSGQDVNMDELGSIADDLNDPDEDGKGPDTASDWTQARSIQAELGQPLTGPDLPVEAKPSRVGEKPRIVELTDSIPALGETCGVFNAVSSIPVIKQASALISEVTLGTVDIALKAAGTSVGELMNSAISLAAGRGVDPYAQGAELGNIANYGARLAANDQALSMGGRELEPDELAVLDGQSRQYEYSDNSALPFAQKYLDPYNADSIVGRALNQTPKNATQFAVSLSNLPKSLASLFGSSLGAMTSDAQAAAKYDYGFDEFGFSAAEQADERFENPYENAVLIEPRLEELNDKYGDCFATRVTPDPADSQRLLIESGESINYATRDKAKCNDGTDDLLRYRFYLADTITAHGLACYEGDEDACTQLGVDLVSGGVTNGTDASPLTSLNGYKLSTTQSKWIKYIADKVKPALPGNSDEQADMAARVTWWSLKEGVLGKDNLVAYSNCGTGDGNTPIGVVDTCSAKTWQVGMAAVQVPNFSPQEVEATASARNPGRTIKQILTQVAAFGGYGADSPTYVSIVNSTGDLRKSLLLRDPATGFTLVDRNVKSECVNGWKEWCGGGWDPAKYVASNAEVSSRVISELTSYFKGISSTGVSGSSQELANQILANPNIDLSASNFCRYCLEDIKNTAAGKPAFGNVLLDKDLLGFLAELGQQGKVDINSITGAGSGHGSNSNHFIGAAVDFGCSLDISRADAIGKKHGISRYSGEWCPNHGHWHYSTTGN